MRTRPAHIEPSCPYCNEGHDPAIECREMPESVRFQLPPERKPVEVTRELIRDQHGKVIAVKQVSGRGNS